MRAFLRSHMCNIEGNQGTCISISRQQLLVYTVHVHDNQTEPSYVYSVYTIRYLEVNSYKGEIETQLCITKSRSAFVITIVCDHTHSQMIATIT